MRLREFISTMRRARVRHRGAPFPRFSRTLGVAVLGAAVIAGGGVADAQEVRGTVRTEQGGTAVPGAIVVLLGAQGETIGGALTGNDGRYRVRLPAAGTYALRVDRVGFRSTAVLPFDVAAGDTVVRDIPVRLDRVALPTVAVTTSSRCDRVVGESGDAARLWDEARKSLEATRLAQSEGRFPVTLQRYERMISLPDSVVRSSSSRMQRGVTDNPFVSLDPDSIAAGGYRRRRGRDDYFYAPYAQVLLSDGFVAGHCFRTRRGEGTAPSVGLAFTPTRGGGRVDIEGVLWLDSATAELRRLEYRYVPAYGSRTTAGGNIDFGRLPSGMFGVQRWRIVVPLLTVTSGGRRPDGAVAYTSDTVVTSYREEGGEVVVATSGGSGPRGMMSQLTVTVWDSTRQEPMHGATVTIEGIGATATTGADGVAHFDSLTEEGAFGVRFWHPRLDSLGVGMGRGPVRLRRGGGDSAALAVPAPAAVAAGRCPTVAPGGRVVTGTVRGPGGTGLPDIEVSLLVDGDGGPPQRLVTSSLESGRFTLCASTASAAWIVATAPAGTTSPLAIPLQETGVVARDIVIAGAPTVATPVVVSAPARPASRVSPLARIAGASGTAQAALDGWGVTGDGRRPRVTVAADGKRGVTADSGGAFHLPLAEGQHTVTVSASGYAPATLSATLRGGERVIVLVALESIYLPAAPRVAAAGRAFAERETGFEARRTSGRGFFFDRAALDKRGATSMSELMRGVPGVTLIPQNFKYVFVSGRGTKELPVGTLKIGSKGGSASTAGVDAETAQGSGAALNQATGRLCEMMFYVDGQPFTSDDGNIDVEIRMADVQGIEIYANPSEVPGRFAGSRARCGVIVIWRRQ